MPVKQQRNYEKLITDVIRNSKGILSVRQVAMKIDSSRATTSRYLDLLVAKGILKTSNLGATRLFWLSDDERYKDWDKKETYDGIIGD